MLAASKVGATVQGVGFIVEVLLNDNVHEDQWVSWTQWMLEGAAETHAAALLRRDDVLRARIVRVDWTVVKEME